MIHLGIAKNLTDNLKIENFSDFYLGAISPDAVHLRENYRESKNISHLRDNWRNYKLILDNAKDFILDNSSHEHRDFYMGYGIHIMTDVYWQKYIDAIEFDILYNRDQNPVHPDRLDAYYKESDILDIRLFKEYEHKTTILNYFIKARPIGIDGLVSAEEVWSLYNKNLERFERRKDEYVSQMRYIVYDEVLSFIDDTAVEIYDYLYRTK